MGFLAFCQAPSKPPKSQFGILEGRTGGREREGREVERAGKGGRGRGGGAGEGRAGGGGGGARSAQIFFFDLSGGTWKKKQKPNLKNLSSAGANPAKIHLPEPPKPSIGVLAFRAAWPNLKC